jgi:hypothetical protein
MRRLAALLPLALTAACTTAMWVAGNIPNAIIVETALSADEAYEAAVSGAYDVGYTIARSDPSRRMFETAPLVRNDVSVAIFASIEGDVSATVLLQGRFSMPGMCDEGPIVQIGERGCRALQAWAELESLAGRIGGVATPVALD